MPTKSDLEPSALFLESTDEAAATEARTSVIDEILQTLPQPSPDSPPAAFVPPALAIARVARVRGGEADILYRGRTASVPATIDSSVDRALIAEALQTKEAVLVEVDPDGSAVIVGLVQTRRPDVLELKARRIVLEAEDEVLLRSGRGALRMRNDGDVELVGSRISTMSRGLFRIVGKILRLN